MPKVSESWRKDKPLYKPVHSSKAGKKGMVYVMKGGAKRLIHFGDSSMTDKKKVAIGIDLGTGDWLSSQQPPP